MIKKSKDLEIIFNKKNFKKEDNDIIRDRKIQISMFFSNTILKLILKDIKDLTIRFLKKKILSFENK